VTDFDVVTGAFSYTGSYIARRLLGVGRRVVTLARRPDPEHPLAAQVEFAPLAFGDPEGLRSALEGASTLYNTYWIRFPHGSATYDGAIENTMKLVAAAAQVGVRRLVHLSVTNAAEDSPLPYFRAKGRLERELRESRLSVAIVRPTLVFGSEDVLVNNIAWLLRRFPVFLVPGRGDYRVQPVAVDDVAAIAVDAAAEERELTIDAAGGEVYRFEELVQLLARAVGSRARIVHAPPRLALSLARAVGYARRDVILTPDELAGLAASLLVSREPPRGRTSFADWVGRHAAVLGRAYVSELARNWRAPV
jgi:NADH dehydrogenase